jgi:hypothetical protein
MAADVSSAKQLVRRHAVAVMDRTARNVETETKVKAPHVTYELRGSIKATRAHAVGSTVEFDLMATADHAEIVAKGSRPHIIRPRRAKMLRFKVGGRTVFARSVRHPGTEPNVKWWSDKALTTRFRSALTRAVAATTTSG